MDKVAILLTLTDDEANGLAQMVKWLSRRSRGKDGLSLVAAEADQAEVAVIVLRDALAAKGYAPR